MKPTTKNVLYMLKESNAIEGVTSRTALIQAHKAWKYAMQYSIMTPFLIRQVHEIIMDKLPIAPQYRGQWRDVPVYIGGDKKSQSKAEIQKQIEKWCATTNKVDRNFDPVTLHIQFEDIHPFIDGNGRVGRLLLNWHLVKRNSSVLLVYTAADRRTYYRLFPSYRAKEFETLMQQISGYRPKKNIRFKEFVDGFWKYE